MDLFLLDVRHGARALSREPGFAAIAILTLALGMGATTAMFGVVRGVLLAPLPYADAESRVMIWSRWTGWDKTWVSSAEIRDYLASSGRHRLASSPSPPQRNQHPALEPKSEVRADLGQAL